MSFPKRKKSAKHGITGQSYFNHYVNQKLDCIYHPIYQENDFGIDGYIELVCDDNVIGKKVAIQIKHGDSYFKSKTKTGYKYYGESKHLNYYLNIMVPVYLVIMNEDFSQLHWVEFDISRTSESGKNGWWINIPYTNTLNSEFKEAIFNTVGPVIDFDQQIKSIWALDKALKKSKYTLISILKDDIDSLSFIRIDELISQFTKNYETLLKLRSTMDIFFTDYDNDEREIFQIPEVVKWLKYSVEHGIPWFYFLGYQEKSNGLDLLLHACCGNYDIKRHDKNYELIYSSDDIKAFFRVNYKNLNNFTEKYQIDESINNEISKGIGNYIKREFNKS
ncbi:DUF4365 domain-containing protein [Abyssisolibacter fermentans]|uniref:DUF4365 domain-containing protein n=1 Tax=Abyssisolibacter fermentans TaxID=1766203 RepID=UPI000831D6AD|nr:DUF4365 and DUF1817 domain-containing protein [Abyssisolibacter fermentans]